MAASDVTPKHLSWIVEGRSDNQSSTMELYEAIFDGDDVLSFKSPELHEAAQELTGIAFSLWRSVFLSDTTGEFDDQRADVKKFLVSLISDNAILYITDKNSRNWSFRYYLDNAIYRLVKLSDGRLGLVAKPALQKSAASDKDEWMNAQAAFHDAVVAFAAAIKAAGL